MAEKIISQSQVEIYDLNNVRINYIKKEAQITYKKTRYDIDYIDKATVIPVTKPLNLIASTIEYLVIFTNNPCKISINGETSIEVNGQFLVAGSKITSIDVVNESFENEVKLEVIQGDELV
jgi:hypothetical protein